MLDTRTWYAVQMDDDVDLDTGSYNHDDALTFAKYLDDMHHGIYEVRILECTPDKKEVMYTEYYRKDINIKISTKDECSEDVCKIIEKFLNLSTDFEYLSNEAPLDESYMARFKKLRYVYVGFDIYGKLEIIHTADEPVESFLMKNILEFNSEVVQCYDDMYKDGDITYDIYKTKYDNYIDNIICVDTNSFKEQEEC